MGSLVWQLSAYRQNYSGYKQRYDRGEDWAEAFQNLPGVQGDWEYEV